MPDNKKELSIYRMERANQCLKSAYALVDTEDYKGAANRSYYAIFNAIRAVLALEGVDFKKHSAVTSYFRQHYIKTGIFNIDLSDIVTEAFQIRQDSDYNDYYVISKEEVTTQIKRAELFCAKISEYLNVQ
ncbi:HEPN domain-containing protein [Christensenellaceae bacterium OttesenSCG-928-K19]|nr:HEPN domain-containing protein [Christensenellaceae bacterium OttesenSCG-928-K19]